MTCKDCLYFRRCVTLGVELNIERNKEADKNCSLFKNVADMVSVVRCKDCKFSHLNRTNSLYSCMRLEKSLLNDVLFKAEDFFEVVAEKSKLDYTPMERADYRVGVPKKKTYKLILDSDSKEFGGTGKNKPTSYKAEQSECDGKEFSFSYPLSPYGVAVFKF